MSIKRSCGSNLPSWWFFPNPFEKYARQIGNLPKVRGENTKIFETIT